MPVERSYLIGLMLNNGEELPVCPLMGKDKVRSMKKSKKKRFILPPL